ncbi:MAG: hypothetical protein KDJ29_05310, partial [Hyphomicrobiales bacterium]|nr:hypothetical protein [Hyphomicrobiales bacterium]
MTAATEDKLKDTKGAGIRSGAQYLAGLRDGRDVWIHGKPVEDVTAEPGIARGAHTLAGFMDRQFDPRYRDVVTYTDSDGIRCARSYQIPKSVDDIRLRGQAYYEWAKWSCGMFGRTPDYKNASVMSFAAALDFLRQGTKGQTDFAANMTSFYDHARRNDLVMTHTLVNPTHSHVQAAQGLYNGDVALHVVKETDAGIIVKGARLLATLGPSADEIEVFPSTVLRASEASVPFAFAFVIPVATKGLRFICRDSYDQGQSHFDAPLASRFEELDAVVIFDDVLVPWERVFMYAQPELCNQAFGATNAVAHMAHQVACGKLAKAEFLVGLMCAMAKASDKDKDPHVKSLISEAMLIAESVRAFIFQAEEQAHEDQYGNFIPARRPLDTSRNLYPKWYT